MCSDMKLIGIAVIVLAVACSPTGKLKRIRNGEVTIGMTIPEHDPYLEDDDGVIIDSIRSEETDGPIIMNAIRDDETGEMVATDVINASRVVARFRNVAERAGYVTIGFDVIVPSAMSDSRWQLKIYPEMRIFDDDVCLAPIYITGQKYREAQLRGYQRYRNFLSSIITDTTDLVRMGQLEIFLERHFPDTYAMKRDSSLIPDPVAENLFGVSQAEALRHYTRHLKVYMNEKRKSRKDLVYGRFVKDPVIREGIRLDTVLNLSSGEFVYRYNHTFRSSLGLRKVSVSMDGEVFSDGVSISRLSFSDDLTFYISSLSTMADMTPKYRMTVVERNVYDNTKALIDFRQGSHEIDTALSDNASEISRIIRCMEDVADEDGLILDSLIIKASCSPEGSYPHNSELSSARSEAVKDHLHPFVPDEWKNRIITSCVPENWDQFRLLVANDTVMSRLSKDRILLIAADLSEPDTVEDRLSRLSEYRYLREKVYPKLRSVSFDFHLHRAGMQKDTIHTTELDTVYMAGVESLRNLDYKTAVEKLRPYADYNSALAFVSADYNHSALMILDSLEDDARVCYLKALAYARLERWAEALQEYEKSLDLDPYMKYRANLDPEMSFLLKKKKINH